MIQSARNILIQRQMKVTPQRLYTLCYFLQHKNHPTIDELYQYLLTVIPNISKTTVYNVLEDLAHAQILEKIPTIDGKMRYDMQIEPHFHLIDISSYTIMDIEDNELIEMIQKHVHQKYGQKYDIKNIHLEIEIKPKT